MAHIFPTKENVDDMPYSERKVYDLLSQLSDDYWVFHSVHWAKKTNNRKTTWKENDFLLFHKNFGGLVIEVKGGDITYSNGVFYQKNTSSGKVHQLDSSKRNDPLSQAIDGVYYYRKLIDATVTSDLSNRFPIETVVWFPSCQISNTISQFPPGYRDIRDAVLGIEDTDDGKKAIRKVLDFYKSYRKTNITDDEFKKIVESIARDFELVTAPSNNKGELDYAFLKLTNEQTSLLDYISEQNVATIQGVAGTGKTIIAKEAARRFAEEGNNVLFLCFNRFLYFDLSNKYKYENVDFFNINTFIAKYRPGEDTSTAALREEVLYSIDYEELHYDDVVIDEAQDFTNNEILFFKDYVADRRKDGHFFAFYDKNQLMTTTEVPEWILNSECKLVLTKNCRNTVEIAKTAFNVIDKDLNQKLKMVSGDPTELYFSNSNTALAVGKIVKKVLDDSSGYSPEDIVILTLGKEEYSCLSTIKQLAGVSLSSDKTKGTILFTTARKFKGLESRVIIIVDIDKSHFSNESDKNVFYVACSRATQKLILVADGSEEEIKEIANELDPSGPFSSKAKIAMKIKADIKTF